MGLWFSSSPCRQCEMKLLQEELDRMEMSCLQGESFQAGGHGRDDHEVGRELRSEAAVCPHPVLGHVCVSLLSCGQQ